MKILGLLILGIISILWGYFSWKYLHIANNDSLTTLILLAGIFVLGILFGKIQLFGNSTSSNKSTGVENEEGSYTTNNQKFIPEIEPITYTETETSKNTSDLFSNFDDIQDNTLLNVANNNKKQDLKVVEGIGPKIESLLNEGGIFSYSDLEHSSINNIKSILEAAGSRYMMHNPSTWKKQAAIAHVGDFKKLKVYQAKLNKGVEV